MSILFAVVHDQTSKVFQNREGDFFEVVQLVEIKQPAKKSRAKPQPVEISPDEAFASAFGQLSLHEQMMFFEAILALLEQDLKTSRADVPNGYDYYNDAYKDNSDIQHRQSQEKLNPSQLSSQVLTQQEQAYGKKTSDQIMASGKNHVLMGEQHDAHPYPAIISTIEAARNKGQEVIYTLEVDKNDKSFANKINELQRNPDALKDPETFRRAVDELSQVCPNSYDPVDFSFSTVSAIAMGAKIELIDNWNMKSKQTRDAYMAQKLEEIYKNHPEAFVLSHFGAAHNQYKGESHSLADEVNYDEVNPLGKRLVDDGYKDGLLSITTSPDAADQRGDYDMSFKQWYGDVA